MPFKTGNNIYATLASSILTSDLTLPLSAGQGARFNFLVGATDYTYATLVHVADNTLEVVKLLGPPSGDNLTVAAGCRGFDGTTAFAFSAGDRIETRIPRALLNNLVLAEDLQGTTDLRPTSIGGSTNVVSSVHAYPYTALATGLLDIFIPTATNTGPMTYAPDGLIAKPIWRGPAGTEVGPGDVVVNYPSWIMYSSVIDAWILLNPQGGLVPTGVMVDFGGSVAPSGWALVDGTSYLQSDLAGLFSVIGTAYGSVDGTHFNVPDSRGRSVIGAGTGVLIEALTSVAASSNSVPVASNGVDHWVTGMPVVLSGVSGFGGTIASGAAFIVRNDSTHVSFASTLAKAQGLAPDITITGTGNVTITFTLTPRALGDKGGEDVHAINGQELPAHAHAFLNSVLQLTAGANQAGTGANNQSPLAATNSTGGNIAMNITQSYFVATKIIKL